jgi:hypothetical protein
MKIYLLQPFYPPSLYLAQRGRTLHVSTLCIPIYSIMDTGWRSFRIILVTAENSLGLGELELSGRQEVL